MTASPSGSHPSSLEALRRRVGSLHQLAGIEVVTCEDGLERGVRKALVRTGAGLEYSVHIDRGFDIGEVRLHGVNLTWRSPVGAAHPHLYQDAPQGWLGRFPGGLLTTCGLDNVGSASQDRPLHGRHSQTPARLLAQRATLENDRYLLELIGEVRQYRLFGDDLVLTRKIRSEYGSNTLHVEDKIENRGFARAPLLLLYHCNFGYPLLDEPTQLRLESHVAPRDEEAAQGLGGYKEIHAPRAGYKEQVFLHDPIAGPQGVVTVGLHHPSLAVGVLMHYLKAQLPYLTQWKQLGEGAYALGLEPGTCHVLGYAEELEAGRVLWLEPGEARRFALLFEFSSRAESTLEGERILEALA